MRAMERAVAGLKTRPDAVFVDGPYVPAALADIGEPVIKGDSKVFSIAAASVIAKV
jgi:ribonuclease HII